MILEVADGSVQGAGVWCGGMEGTKGVVMATCGRRDET